MKRDIGIDNSWNEFYDEKKNKKFERYKFIGNKRVLNRMFWDRLKFD